MHRDQGGQDKSTTNPANFLGEVLLNIVKLKPWDGIILEQAFELRQVEFFGFGQPRFNEWTYHHIILIRQGHYESAPRPSGQLFLKLKYQSESVVIPRPNFKQSLYTGPSD